MAKKVKHLDSGYWHEAMDRSYCVTEIIQSMLLDHPAIEQTKPLYKKILKAQELIAEAYQDCGNRFYTATKNNKKKLVK
jgi:hypothetical protein